MVYFVDGVLASGVEIILEMDFVCFALQELEIHSFMIQIRTLSMILQTFSTTHNLKHTRNSIDHQPQSIQEDLNQQRMNDVLKAMKSLVEKLRQQEQAANLSTHTPEPSRCFNFIYDNDEESTIPLNEIISQIPSSISEDTSDNDSECDFPFCDDSFPLDILGGNSMTFSNPLFDSNDDFTSSDDESLLEEDDIESKDSYVSNLDEQALLVTHLSELNEDECFDPGGDEIEACLTSDSIPPEIDDADFNPEGDILLLEKLLSDDTSSSLPLKELYFEDLKVIKSSIDTPPDFKDDYYDSKGDIIYLESLLIKDTTHNIPPKVFFDHDPKSLKDEHDNEDLKSMIKVFDLGIHEKIISLTYVKLSFEDRHYFFHTFVIKTFLLFPTYLVNYLLLLSFGSEDTIFDLGISAYSFYSLEPVAYESSMMIFPFFYFCPKDKGIRGESS
ncbi:hypothetical protein Tco_0493693 [Tanacetum coccineum]